MEAIETISEISVLLIEDNPGDQKLIKEYFQESKHQKFKIKNSFSLKEGIKLLQSQKYDAVMLDLGLPDSSGLDSLKSIKAINDLVPVVVLTMDKSEETGLEAIRYGAQDYLVKDDLQHINLSKSIRYAIGRKKLELDLMESLDQYERTFEQATVGIAHLSFETTFLKLNQRFCDILGYSKKELMGKSSGFITYPADLEKDLVEIENLISGKKKSYILEKRFIHKNGSVIWTNLTRTAILNKKNEIEYFFTTLEDITERKNLEYELHKQKNILDNIISILPVGIWFSDENGNIVKHNKKAEEIWGGVKDSNIIGTNHSKAWWADSGKLLSAEDWASYRALKNKEISLGEILNIQCFDSSKKTILNSAVPLIEGEKVTGVLIVNEDITKLMETEKQLKALVEEKELLIKESHHRIKNNLQLVTSLIKLSISKTDNDPVQSILNDCLNRVASISTLHGYIYRSSELNEVNVQIYIYKLIDYLRTSLLFERQNIKIVKNIENIPIDSALAISLGLLVNELTTNAVKYAFDEKEGIIDIEIKREDKDITLIVKDNGKGIPESIDITNSNTLGFQIINSLVNQHNGKIQYNVKEGTEFRISLPID
jgi:PAS domain S-box-containing protein